MPFVEVPNTLQVNVVWEWNGQECENTLYYEKETGVSETDAASLISDLATFIASEILPLLSNTIKLVRLVGVLLDAVDALTVITTAGLPQNGGVASDAVPNNVAATISLRTAARGRSFRGRNFIPGIPKSLVIENVVDGGLLSDLAAAYTSLISIGGDDGWQQVIVSRFSGFTIVGGRKVPTPRATGVTTPVTNAFFVDNIVDAQRRRLPGRGR